jgi:hypothetical protein
MVARGAQWQRDGSQEEVSWWPKWMRAGVAKDLMLLYMLGTASRANGQRNYAGSEWVI